MKYVSANEVKQNFGRVMEDVQRGPVVVKRYNRETAVIISREDYEEFRKYQVAQLLEIGSRISEEAQANGLTQKVLDEILSE